MGNVEAYPEIRPEIMEKLASAKDRLWLAAHADGSDNRIDGESILEASTYGAGVGLLEAAWQWIRKRFRNRDKTREDLAAEKEAASINQTCDALEQMLLEYFRAVRQGAVGEEALDELTGVLQEMHGYQQAGKLQIPGRKELEVICGSITAYTQALAGDSGAVPPAETRGADAFALIREQLLRQKELIFGGKAG